MCTDQVLVIPCYPGVYTIYTRSRAHQTVEAQAGSVFISISYVSICQGLLQVSYFLSYCCEVHAQFSMVALVKHSDSLQY